MPVTSTLNCSANSTTTGSEQGSSGEPSDGSRSADAHVCRTSALIRPIDPSGDSAINRASQEITERRYCAWLTLDM